MDIFKAVYCKYQHRKMCNMQRSKLNWLIQDNSRKLQLCSEISCNRINYGLGVYKKFDVL